jgi:hypothetical protein
VFARREYGPAKRWPYFRELLAPELARCPARFGGDPGGAAITDPRWQDHADDAIDLIAKLQVV